MASSKKQRMIDAAEAIVRDEGYRAASVERILAEADIAKMTLYNHFATKDELLAQVVANMDDAAIRGLRELAAGAGPSGRERLKRLVAVILDSAGQRGDRGCVFLRTAAEFPEPGAPPRAGAARHYGSVIELFAEYAREAGLAPEAASALATEVVTILAGAFTLGSLIGSERVIPAASRQANAAIDAAAGDV